MRNDRYYTFDRFREPSTWAGVGVASAGAATLADGLGWIEPAAAVGLKALPHLVGGNWIVGGLMLVGGLASIFTREKGWQDRPPPSPPPGYRQTGRRYRPRNPYDERWLNR